ncbi:MAG: dipeptidase [Gemmatimonadetes bacterium]|nr:dipeptidase [Gemmatimonadota bacterium]
MLVGACGSEEAGSPAPADSGRDPLAHARVVLDRTPIFDGHNDLPWEIRASEEAPMDVAAYDLNLPVPGHTNLELLEAGGVGAQFWSVYIPGEYADSGFARLQLEQIDLARRMIDRYPELVLAGTADEVEAVMADGRIASMLGVEGGHAIENSLGALRAYYDLGARYMTLTHNVTLDWADAAQDTALHDGLSAFGEEVVREMNRLGMLVDLSHASPATMSDALTVSEAPVIFSHSSARALTDVPRNVPDSILARMAGNGGVVMVTFVQPFVNQEAADYDDALAADIQAMRDEGRPVGEIRAEIDRIRRESPRPPASIDDIADHIEHVRRVAGIDHVGIGSDYDGMNAPPEMPDVSSYPVLFARLIERGWTDEELGKLASGNILKALREAEAAAARLQGERQPSTAAIADFAGSAP